MGDVVRHAVHISKSCFSQSNILDSSASIIQADIILHAVLVFNNDKKASQEVPKGLSDNY